jgi:hypothetical protein
MTRRPKLHAAVLILGLLALAGCNQLAAVQAQVDQRALVLPPEPGKDVAP